MLLRKYFITLLPVLLAAMLSVTQSEAGEIGAPSLAAATETLFENGGYAVTRQGGYIATHNLDRLYVPASVIKIATALAALDVLGPDYRFPTNFYLDSRQNLYIQGFGDPFLISEEAARIAANLKELGCGSVRDIYIDDSSFDLAESADGTGLSDNPYDAQNSGLAVNFNTVNIEKDRSGRAVSAEAQTPTLPMMAKLANDLEAGTHRINITRAEKYGAAVISSYAGELFRAFLQREAVAVTGTVARQKTPEGLAPFYRHESSKTLEDIVGPLMLYSNNFIANQLFLAVGGARHGYPATWEKGRAALEEILREKYALSANEIKMFEGSGLSRKNRVSPHAMIRLLDAFKPFARLLPLENGRFLKSGTLQGVYSYAGYFTEKEGLDSFVLLLNQEKNSRNRVLDRLERFYRSHE